MPLLFDGHRRLWGAHLLVRVVLIQAFRFDATIGWQEWHAVINALITVLNVFFSIVFVFGCGVSRKFLTKSG